MPKKPRLALPLLLLAGTTLAIGAIVYGLLWREAERLRQANLIAAHNQAATVAENIGLTIGEIKTAVIEALLAFEGPDFAPQLASWQSQDPLVAFAFSWSSQNPDTLNLFPQNPKHAARLTPLIRPTSQQWIWNATRSTIASKLSPQGNADSLAQNEVAPESYNFADNSSLRQSIRSKSQLSTQVAKSAYRKRKTWSSDSTQWIHEIHEGESYWIGIARWNRETAITGAAVKLSDIAHLLQKSFPSQLVDKIAGFAIQNENGKTIAQTRDPRSPYLRSGWTARSSPERYPLDPELPGWTLLMHTRLQGSMTSALTSAAGISTAIALLTLFSTGLWLVWQSRASQLDAAKKVSFVSNVSHELKTPLTTIRMYSELLQSGRVQQNEKRTKYLDTISGESQRLTRLVNNVLDFSRIEQGKTKLSPAPQNLDAVLQQYLELRQSEITAHAFTLKTDLQTHDATATFDRDALCQIIGNLIDNSLKYAANGKHIRIQTSATPKHVTLHFSDHGPGLPSHLRKKKFQAFTRGDDSLTAETSGFGLGLNIAQTLAAEMNAQLSYQHPRAKTERPTFTLLLPR